MRFEMEELEALRFYGVLQMAVLAWAAISLALGGMLSLSSAPLAVLTMGGMLAILGLAMRSKSYSHLKHRAED